MTEAPSNSEDHESVYREIEVTDSVREAGIGNDLLTSKVVEDYESLYDGDDSADLKKGITLAYVTIDPATENELEFQFELRYRKIVPATLHWKLDDAFMPIDVEGELDAEKKEAFAAAVRARLGC